MREVHVVGIHAEPQETEDGETTNQAVLILRETQGAGRYLPIYVGPAEATAIVLEQEGVVPLVPLTHDLIKNLLAALERPLLEVQIVDLCDGTFITDLVFHGGLRVRARPSDAVNIAMRTHSPIYVEERLLDDAGYPAP